jgi:hypothetical protein
MEAIYTGPSTLVQRGQKSCDLATDKGLEKKLGEVDMPTEYAQAFSEPNETRWDIG